MPPTKHTVPHLLTKIPTVKIYDSKPYLSNGNLHDASYEHYNLDGKSQKKQRPYIISNIESSMHVEVQSGGHASNDMCDITMHSPILWYPSPPFPTNVNARLMARAH